jgi:mRNA-degrading endonuclease toxin of MazEF toxin-antitoxin module
MPIPAAKKTTKTVKISLHKTRTAAAQGGSKPAVVAPHPKRGDIFIADLTPNKRGEVGKKRLVLVASPDAANGTAGNGTITILPISSVAGTTPLRIPVKAGTVDGWALVREVRSIGVVRLDKKPVATIPAATMSRILQTLRNFFT